MVEHIGMFVICWIGIARNSLAGRFVSILLLLMCDRRWVQDVQTPDIRHTSKLRCACLGWLGG